jgi:hypothetical protein
MLLLIILFIFIYFLFFSNKETFNIIYGFPSRINRPTRNMSYDLRGEAYYPPLLNLPFDNSSIEPHLDVPNILHY